MIPLLERVSKIRDSLTAALGGSYNDSQLNDVVKLCHAFAFGSIEDKLKHGSLSEEFVGLNRRDIAWDCIADLFQRDENGGIVRLKAYFDGVQIEGISDEELLSHFRRLVFSKVNDGLFRIYQQVDPSLSKIIRNVKFVVSTLHNYDEMEKLGEHCICPSFVERRDHLPAIETDLLEKEMRRRAHGTERIPDLMAKLSLFLRQQDEYCRVVPLTIVARVFRAIYTEPPDMKQAEPLVEDDMLIEDAEQIIKQACHEVESKMAPKYAIRKSIHTDFIESYFCVIEGTLVERLLSHDGKSTPLFARMRTYFPDLKRNEYEKRHKRVLEYLLKLSTAEAKKRLNGIYA